MIVGYLLLGVFALCGASRPPRRGAFAPVPEINPDTPLMVEGDIAVTESNLGSGTVQNAFRTNQDSRWPKGIVPFRIATDEWGGLVEPVFLETQIDNITQAHNKIMDGVPCIEFRSKEKSLQSIKQTFHISREVDESFPDFHLIYTNMGAPNLSAHLCFSYVGRTDPDGPGKGQVVNLGSAECLAIEKILHETLHSLGWKL